MALVKGARDEVRLLSLDFTSRRTWRIFNKYLWLIKVNNNSR